MISAVLPTLTPIPALVDSLTALVPAVAEGLVRDVVIVAREETPFLTAITDAGGSALVITAGDHAGLIMAGAQHAKASHVLVLEPGMVPQGDWIATLSDCVADIEGQEAALLPLIGAPWLTWMARLTGRADRRLGLVATKSALVSGGKLRFTPVQAELADRRKRRLRSAAG